LEDGTVESPEMRIDQINPSNAPFRSKRNGEYAYVQWQREGGAGWLQDTYANTHTGYMHYNNIVVMRQ